MGQGHHTQVDQDGRGLGQESKIEDKNPEKNRHNFHSTNMFYVHLFHVVDLLTFNNMNLVPGTDYLYILGHWYACKGWIIICTGNMFLAILIYSHSAMKLIKADPMVILESLGL